MLAIIFWPQCVTSKHCKLSSATTSNIWHSRESLFIPTTLSWSCLHHVRQRTLYTRRYIAIVKRCVMWKCNWSIASEAHYDIIKWKHFPRYWPFVRGIHHRPENSLHKCQWHGTLMFSLICAWTNGWVNTRDAGDLRHHRARYDVNVMNLREYRQISPINSSPCAAYVCQWFRSALVQIMASRLFGARPLSKPMLHYCPVDT